MTLELFGDLEISEVSELLEVVSVQMDFGFSFGAMLTIDTVLDFGSIRDVGDRRRERSR